MRILLTTDALGGVWDYSVTLARGLAAEGHAVLLACLGEPPADAYALLPPEVELATRELPLEWTATSDAEISAGARWLHELARRWRADLAHLNQMAYSAGPFDVPALAVSHSDVLSWYAEVRGTAAPPEWADYARWVRAGLAGADAVVAPTRYQSELLRRGYGIPAHRVIHNAAPEAEPPVGGERERAVLAAGRAWDEGKGMRVLDEAASLLGPAAPAIELYGPLTGPGGERYVPSCLLARGRVPRRELEARMARAAVFVSPSLYEPFGLAPLEAALRGCPLLLSDIGSFRELWQGCAGYFPPGDAVALATELEALLNDPARREALARAGRKRAAERYTVDRFLRDYLDLYHQLAASGAPAAAACSPSKLTGPCA